MKRQKISLLVFASIVMLLLIGIGSKNKVDCRYSNYAGTFTFEEMNSQERNFSMAVIKFQEFKKLDNRDTILYRLCKTNFLKFWYWGAYLFSKRYQLPYASWNEIKLRRGPITNKTGFQDF